MSTGAGCASIDDLRLPRFLSQNRPTGNAAGRIGFWTDDLVEFDTGLMQYVEGKEGVMARS